MQNISMQSTDLNQLLDSGPWSAFQKGVVALTAGAVVFDGLDIQSLGYVVPAIAKEWKLGREAFAPVLGAGLFGVALGSAFGGMIGDRKGRRPALIASVIFFALCTLGMALCHSLSALLLLRFGAGLGIGGALPNAATMSSEFTPRDFRPMATTLTIVCIPLGGALAGLLTGAVLDRFGWRMLFALCGLVPLLYSMLLLAALPESPRFLARQTTDISRLRSLLIRMGRPTASVEALQTDIDPKTGAERGRIADLFSGTQGRDTLALWGAFFFCLLTVYLAFNWLPSSLVSVHLASKEATMGLTLYNFGGIAGALLVGWWISLSGSRIPMALSAGLAIASALGLAWLVTQPVSHGPILTAVCVHGLAVNAVQTTLYALATQMYETRIRSTGTALALAMGRTGAIISAFFGAHLLRSAPRVYFGALAITMLLVLLAILTIRKHIAARQSA